MDMFCVMKMRHVYLKRLLHGGPLLHELHKALLEISPLLPKIMAAQWVRIPGGGLSFVSNVPGSYVFFHQRAQAATTIGVG